MPHLHLDFVYPIPPTICLMRSYADKHKTDCFPINLRNLNYTKTYPRGVPQRLLFGQILLVLYTANLVHLVAWHAAYNLISMPMTRRSSAVVNLPADSTVCL